MVKNEKAEKVLSTSVNQKCRLVEMRKCSISLFGILGRLSEFYSEGRWFLAKPVATLINDV